MMRTVTQVLLAAMMLVPSSHGRIDDQIQPGLSPDQLARAVDQTLEGHWQEQQLKPTPPIDDATFLRRLSLDLRGTIPTREEVATFLHDKSPKKRAEKIRAYLEDPETAEYRAATWSQLLLSDAAKGPEAAYLYPWLVESFAADMPFDDVVHELISATGENDEVGAASFVLSYRTEPETLAAVTARSFLGLQIQCAQCHDHPYEDWTQDDFNGFAAFFAFTNGRQVDADAKPPVYELNDFTEEEFRKNQWQKLVKVIRRYKNSGSAEEDDQEQLDRLGSRLQNRKRPERQSAALDRLVSHLPDEIQQRIQDARSKQERFAIAKTLDGETAEDVQSPRREQLANWIVSPNNKFFAKAVVNRVSQQLFGYALIEPLDDLGGSDDVIVPQLLDILAIQFQRHDYSLDYLYETLALTKAYALAPSEKDEPDRVHAERHLAARVIRPLTAEQTLSSLVRATGIEHTLDQRPSSAQRKLRNKISEVFMDEGEADALDFEAAIPQALFLMNGKLTNAVIEFENNVLLQQILQQYKDNANRLQQMFFATLGRHPTNAEKAKLSRALKSSRKGHGDTVSDIYWALLNSSEFLSNH